MVLKILAAINGKVMKNKKLIIIWSSVFREFDYYRLELEHISKKFDIEVHEMIKIFNPGFEKAYHSRCTRKIVKRYQSMFEWKSDFKKLIQKYEVVALSMNKGDNFFKFLVNCILYINKVPIIKFSPGVIPNKKITLNLIIHKFKNNFSLKILFFYLENKFCFKLSNFLFKADYLIARSGSDYQHFKKKNSNFKTKIVKGSYYDFSNALIYKPSKKDIKYKANSFSLLLDTPGPRHPGDELLHTYKPQPYHTSEKWFPKINDFFSFLEKNFHTKVKIAPHPKIGPSKFPKDFNFREVVSNKLTYMAKNAKIIISKAPGSAGLVYAALFEKPILLIFSNEMLDDRNIMEDFKAMAVAFKVTPINIDKNYTKKMICQKLKIKTNTYRDYLKKYSTARNDKKPNYQIVIELLNSIFSNKNKFRTE